MDKLYHNNAFSLLEMLMVLLMISIFSISFMIPKDNLTIFMDQMLMYSVISQEEAFIEKKDVNVTIENHYAQFGNITFEYPDSIACSIKSFHYNSKGNISSANTVTCSNGTTSKSLIYQLGSGRVRIDES